MSTTKKTEPATEKCVVPGCSNDAQTRGLCNGCYLRACKLVNDRADTKEGREAVWKDLEEKGLAREPEPRGRPSRFSKALEEAEREETEPAQ